METVLLVGVRLKTDPPDQTSLEELKRLTHTAGGGVARVFQVRVNAYQAATLIGRGKMEEIAVLWETENKNSKGKHLYGRTSEKENLIAFYGDETNNRPFIKGYFQDNE